MEISERELRDLLRAVDDEHRDGMRTAAADIAAVHAETRRFRRDARPAPVGAPRGPVPPGAGPGTPAASRRAFLARAGAGAAGLLAAGGILSLTPGRRAGAQEAEAPDDSTIAAFTESVELTMAEAYASAAAGGRLSAPMVAAANLFAGHHREHASAFAAVAGAAAEGKPNARLAGTVADQLRNAQDETAVLQIAYDLEDAAAATYLYAIGVLEAKGAVRLAASILPVESQHAVVIGRAMGKTVEAVVPSFENLDNAIDLAKFPVAAATTTTTTTE